LLQKIKVTTFLYNYTITHITINYAIKIYKIVKYLKNS
jgi:hypothetical protein